MSGLPKDEAIKRLRAMVEDFFDAEDASFRELAQLGQEKAFVTMVIACHGLTGALLRELGVEPGSVPNRRPPNICDAPQFAMFSALSVMLAILWDFDERLAPEKEPTVDAVGSA